MSWVHCGLSIVSLCMCMHQMALTHTCKHHTHTHIHTGLRYLEAFFGLLIAIMCGMFGWMVSSNNTKSIFLHIQKFAGVRFYVEQLLLNFIYTIS